MKKSLMPLASLAALMAAQPVAVIGSVRADAGGGDVAQLMKDVKAQLDRVTGETNKTAENALKEAQKAGALTAETKTSVDQLLNQQGVLQTAFDKLEKHIEGMDANHLELEQRLGGKRGDGGDLRQTLGMAIAQHDGVKGFTKGSLTFTVSNAITTGSASAGALKVPQRETEIVGLPRRQFFVRDLLSRNTTDTDLIQYARLKTRDLKAAPVEETTIKPMSNLEYEEADAKVVTLAHWIPVSRQAMDDIPQLQGEIDNELVYGLDLTEENQILSGDGEGQNLPGLITNATAYSAAYEPEGSTRIDRLRFAMLEASLAGYPADGMVLNEIEWALIETTKDNEGRYIFANPLGLAGPVLWSRPIVATPQIAQGDFLTGAFRVAATIYDRMDTEIAISSEDRDNFVKNMLTVRAEKRLALAIKRRAALVHGSFAVA
ncbi:phage major capsid protein [Falsirhodobacter halotolerans]|uniref:phage major capsid protein n=1 Tax=Falsirhodobacter halotolerans TaxID=1146892 RepID=UPI001FD32191|nr:phage major capsid protein [Falsirhodobacter halotolerans]MCJ8138426.1 phage major capsid protein [Falsirhodobacter halotolerans]